jgi:uncharacterized protein (TIGR02996 family)
MSIELGLLSDIIENPDDDLPRQVFADYFDDQGEVERAEFIRLQLIRAASKDLERNRLLLRREEELLAKNRHRWVRCFQQLGVGWPGFSRGFVEAVEIDTKHLLDVADQLLALAPIRELILLAPAAHLHVLNQFGWLTRMHTLRLVLPHGAARLTMMGLNRLACNDHLAELRTLDLAACELTSSHLQALADGSGALRPFELSLARNALPVGSLMGLIGSPFFSRLRTLDLSDNALANDDLIPLFTLHAVHFLEHLDIRGNPVGDEAMVRLLDRHPPHPLKSLFWSEEFISPFVSTRLRQRFGSQGTAT